MNILTTFTTNSDGSNSSSHSDEELPSITLASEKPKKRAGRRVFKETRHPVYRGVRRRDKDKWVCEVRVPNNNKLRIWLGTHNTPEKAARAHDVAALALRGKSACLNFADSAWRLPIPASTDPDVIRRVAMEAVEAFDGDEVCSSTARMVEEEEAEASIVNNYSNDNNNNNNGVGFGVSEFGDDEVLFSSMADEPLRSPPAAYSLGTQGWDWRDEVDQVDSEVSLWSFTI